MPRLLPVCTDGGVGAMFLCACNVLTPNVL